PNTVPSELFPTTIKSSVDEYTKIANISYTSGYSPFATFKSEGITKALSKQACILGADGLIITDIKEGSYWSYRRGRGEALAIRLTEGGSVND
ncbi:MAG: hypothetical protein HC902_09445, partial [Calothrix sp. SM1_5_4]|nr:hypothetical protein [Calothrix sp. SM1_5_4]